MVARPLFFALLGILYAGPAVADGADAGQFRFGSYGRLVVGSDLHGGTPEPVAVVEHGPRIVEPSYVELDFRYRAAPVAGTRGLRWQTVTTLALGDSLFHYDGQFDSNIAVRNLYIEATLHDSWGAWIGSRMYRGDDIYLLDFWPLDDQNTVGAGLWRHCAGLELAAHLGVNRLRDDYQFQQVQVPDTDQGSTVIDQLDRQRFVTSGTASYRGTGWLAKIHGELQAIDSGTARREADQSEFPLPSDFGWQLGAQLGAWNFAGPTSNANLYVRYARGLAAFDELAVPADLDANKRAYPRASELLVGASATYAAGRTGIQFGGYARRFRDADRIPADRDDGWELVADLRPQVVLVPRVHVAIDLSYQKRFPRGISPTALEIKNASIWQLAPMVVFSPSGDAPFARPHFRVVYRTARLSNGALDLYPTEDPRRTHRWVHFLGVQAEWWFDASYR